jgi:hypothetical protein
MRCANKTKCLWHHVVIEWNGKCDDNTDGSKTKQLQSPVKMNGKPGEEETRISHERSGRVGGLVGAQGDGADVVQLFPDKNNCQSIFDKRISVDTAAVVIGILR